MPAEGLVVWQPRRAFRYGSEAFWLVGFALEGGVPRSALDLGTGSGIAALLLGRCGIPTTGIDLRSEWAEGWERTLSESTLAAPVALLCEEVGAYEGPAVELIVSNPPFFAAGSGPVASDPWKAAARTESAATLADFVAAAVRLSERACFVVPVERGEEVAVAATRLGWGVARRVHVGRRRALLEVRPGGQLLAAEQIEEGSATAQGWVRLATGAG